MYMLSADTKKERDKILLGLLNLVSRKILKQKSHCGKILVVMNADMSICCSAFLGTAMVV